MGLCLYRHLAQRRLEALLPFRLCCCIAYRLLRPSRCPLLHYCCHHGSFMSPVFWTGFTSGFTSGFTGGSLDRRRTVPAAPLVECRLQLAPLFWALLLTSRHFPPCLSACGFGRYCFSGVMVLGGLSCGWVRISSCHSRPLFRLCCYLPLGALLLAI